MSLPQPSPDRRSPGRTRSAAALACATLLLAAAGPAAAAPEFYDLDPGHTYPGFEIDHLGFSTMRGIFRTTSGTLAIDPANRRASVTATIAAASIDTGHAERDEHLRKPEFFDVATHPTLVFRAQDFTWDPPRSVSAEGRLTMLGVTRPVTLTVAPTRCAVNPINKAYTCGALVTTTLKRSDWGLKTYLPLIGDEVRVQIGVEAIRRPGD